MKTQLRITSVLIAGAFLLGTQVPANPTLLDITALDYSWGTPVQANTYFSPTTSTGHGVDFEDNETEWNTMPGQRWDLEAMLLKPKDFDVPGDTAKLYLIGGFDFANGVTGAGGPSYPTMNPGDLFIKIAPQNQPPTWGPVVATNPLPNSYFGYDFAVSLNNLGSGFTSGSRTVYSLDNNSLLDDVQHPDRRGNPWKYVSGATGTTTTNVSLTSYASSAALNTWLASNVLGGLSLYGSTGTVDDGRYSPADMDSDVHYVLTIDLGSWVTVPANNYAFFSYTMECGNDALKGGTGGGFTDTPDGGMTLVLLGLSLLSFLVYGQKIRKA